ncbi:MAG: hypothetical protein WCO93_11520 [bacterium]
MNRLVLLLVILYFTFSISGKAQFPCLDPTLSDDQRIDDLISRLTLAEKTSLML